MLFDTHTHLQFKAFSPERSRRISVDKVINDAKKAGIKYINIVGTDLDSSKQAIEIANKNEDIFAVIGIHPHHIYQYLQTPPVILSETKNLGPSASLQDDLVNLEKLIDHPKVIGVGETGIDRQIYTKTKYENYEIEERFITLQKKAFEFQIKLAIKYEKSLVIHNINAADDLLDVLEKNWDEFLSGRSVFHCCEPSEKLLDFAIKNKVYIGIDGDITEYPAKQEFIKKIPLDLLVLETDSPFLSPVGFKNPNTPSNLNYICEYISKILKVKQSFFSSKNEEEKLERITFKNSQDLFNLKS